MVLHQLRYDLLASFRNPRARFFTFFFPVLLLVIFAGVFGNGHTTVDGVTVKLSRYYVPGILAMSILTAAYGSLVVSVASARETGVLKRRRATPVPAAVLLAGQALSTLSFACIAYAVSGMIGSVDAARPIVQATMLPLYFISGVWIPTQTLGSTLRGVASVFPVENLAAALHLASVRGSFGSAISGKDLLVLGIWALGAAAFAARRFSWLPSTASA